MSDVQQSWATLSLNFVAQQSWATKWLNFVAQLCCLSDLSLPNFWRVAQLICRIETISILRQFLTLSLSCDWSIVCLHVNCWFCCKLLTYYLLYISFNKSYFKSKLNRLVMEWTKQLTRHYWQLYRLCVTRSHVCWAIVCQWKIDSCVGKFVAR